MFGDGLLYTESHMSSVNEFIECLHAFDIKDPKAKLPGGPVLYRDGGTAYVDASEAHSLIFGDTGSMKTLRFVLPMIYTCAMAGESMVIVDPKGELVRKSAPFLEKKGFRTAVLDFRHPENSRDRWNPMAHIEKLYKGDENQRDCAEVELNDIINLIFAPKAGVKDPYWDESAGQFALGLCQLILKRNEPLNMGNLLEWRHAKMAAGELTNAYNELNRSDPIAQNLGCYLELTAQNTRSCILSTFDQNMRLFRSIRPLTRILSEGTFDMNSIGLEKTAVFLVIPDDKTTLHFLATLFISQCYSALLETAEQFNGRLPVRVNLILEEFCNMPELKDIVPMISAARSRNIRIHMVIQSYGQLADKYGDNVAHALLDNCGNLIYLHTREVQFLNYISELAGRNEYSRPLISASRLQRLKKNETLIFHDRCYPFLTEDIPLIFEYPMGL